MDAAAVIQDQQFFLSSTVASRAHSAVLTASSAALSAASSVLNASEERSAAGAAVGSTTTTTTSSSPVVAQFARIMRSLATVILKQTAEVDIPDRRIGTFVAYLTSPFALLCMLMALVLNRTVVFASVRRPQSLPAYARLLIRAVAIVHLARATGPLFTALKCYSPGLAPYIPEYFAVDTSQEKCPGPDILWYLYKAFCTGHFVETFACALQGRVPSPDTGMTLFEYSLAFQEAQSAQRPSVEVLVISLIWALNYLTLLIISVFDLQNYRLIPSSVFGTISLVYFAVSTYHGRAQFFPTVWVIGFAPHLAVLYVIIFCGAIYLLASVFAGGSSNLQSSVRSVNISLSEDFYSCLLKLGILVLTSAADATYMAEGPTLAVPENTWIEALEFQKRAGFEYINESPDDAPVESRLRLRDRISFSTEKSGELPSGFSLPRRRRGHGHHRHRRLTVSGYGSHNLRVGAGMNGINAASEAAAAGRKTGRVRRLVLFYRVRMAYKLVSWCFRIFSNLAEKATLKIKRLWTVPAQDAHEDVQNNVTTTLSDDDYYKLFLQGELPEDDMSGDFELSDEDDEEDEEVSTEIVTSELFPQLTSDVTLSSLLLPQTAEERRLARVMVAHLSTDEIVTRSRMVRYEQDSKVVDYSSDSESDGEEEALLVSIINERRSRVAQSGPEDDEFSSYRPSLCVVCHSAEREVVLWPCRCLAVCDECRVSLALRNFKGCVCCRRDVISFSRLFVP